MEMAQRCSPQSLRLIKREVYEAPFQTLAEAVAMANADMLVTNASADFAEGSRAVLEKRPPVLVGR